MPTLTDTKSWLYKKLSFISLISKNHKLRQICIEQVLQNKQMINLGRLSDQKNASEYHIQEISQDYHGIPLRCSVVYSTHLAEQKKATFARQLKKEQLQLEKDTEKLIEHNFVCSFIIFRISFIIMTCLFFPVFTSNSLPSKL